MNDAAPKLRLKPRLFVEASPQPANEASCDVGSAAAANPPPVSPMPATAPKPLVSLLSLKPTVVVAEPPLLADCVPRAEELDASSAAAPADAAPPAAVSESSARQVRVAAVIIAAAGVLVFGITATIAYPRLLARTRQIAALRERWATEARAERASRATTPANTPANALPPAPAAARQAAPPARADAKSRANVPPPVTAPAATKPNPPQAAAAAERAPDSFRAWVAAVKIAGVRRGAAPRILIGNRAFNVGEVVNAELGIVFESYDAVQHLIRFRDRTGTVVERRDR